MSQVADVAQTVSVTVDGGDDAEARAGTRLRDLIQGYRSTALLYVAARLGIADALGHGPRRAADLARALGAHTQTLHRVMRGLVALGVLAEEADGAFALTALGQRLRRDAPGSQRTEALLSGEEFAPAWGGLLHSVRTGEPAFPHVFGMTNWEHRAQHPELNALFNDFMRQLTEPVTAAVVAGYDFSRFRVVADIGGGNGALLAAVLRANPSLRGLLFDQPHVVAEASAVLGAAGVADRCTAVGGSFFEEVPPGADAYLLKSVLHDWDDPRSIAILDGCRRAMGAAGDGGGTLLLVERILPERVGNAPDAIWSDLHMLVMNGALERTLDEWRALLAAGGFRLEKVVHTGSGLHVLEAVPAAGAGRAPQ